MVNYEVDQRRTPSDEPPTGSARPKSGRDVEQLDELLVILATC